MSKTIITLDLPSTKNGIKRRGTGQLLIARGQLAHITSFTYTALADIGAIIQQAEATLVSLEIDPPPDFSTDNAAEPPAKAAPAPAITPTPTPDLSNHTQPSLF